MGSPEDVFPADECCEICGARLDDEVVIQEFADGSLARLCPECAAGAALDPEPAYEGDYFPDDDLTTPTIPAGAAENDPLEMTRELLVPVTDLIGLQTEMQAALERLAASLERFATGVITDNIDKTADVDSRLRSLEDELERTRARLREAESLLVATGNAQPEADATGPAAILEPKAPVVPLPLDEFATGTSARESRPADEEWPPLNAQETAPVEFPTGNAAAESLESAASNSEGTTAPDVAETPVPTAVPAPQGEQHGQGESFRLEEVQWAQRYFNESPFTKRIREIRRSLGKPKANLTRVQGTEPRVLVTVIWDIVWYQYLVNARKDAPVNERVAMFREGMDLDELAPYFRERNASIDDDGRLDASELEVRLLSDPTVLITEMDSSVDRALEDATEEIWDQHISPEFKWDD